MAENHILLQSVELSAAASSVTLSGIPQTGYTDLKLVVSARSAVATNGDALYGRFNASSTGYTSRILYGEANGSGSFANTNPYAHLGYSSAATATADTFGNIEIYIPNYTSSVAKVISVNGVTSSKASTYQSSIQALNAVLWNNSEAISSIVLTQESAANFTIGSTFSLYGVAALNTTPAIAPLAGGGNIVSTDGTYWYHTFLSSSTFTPFKALTCDYLVVAGGGGGGRGSGAGGGAGGYRTSIGGTPLSFLAQDYKVVVGAGGRAMVAYLYPDSSNGSDSSISSITSVGGGGGAGYNAGTAVLATMYSGAAGGSGGGAWGNTPSVGGTPTSGQGNAGGIAGGGSGYGESSGGGGGAGGGGGNGGSNNGICGNGGVGLANSISGTSTFYAGGGGGAYGSFNYGTQSAGSGGNGGGGAGGTGIGSSGTGTINGGNGTAGRGGGGGGGSYSGQLATIGVGGNGGSGVVIIRYPVVS